MSIRDVVNTDLYPIDAENSVARSALIDQCRAELSDHALCRLPNFIRPNWLAAMVQEIHALEEERLHVEHSSTVYPWMDNSGFPGDHPRSTLFKRRFGILITDLIPTQTLVRGLFMWDPLTEFVRDALGFEKLFRSVCPTESVQVNLMYDGDVLGWHFDTNDGVVSLLLDSADEGGHFQVAPYLRDERNEHYELVARAFEGDPAVVLEPEMSPGTFALFKGRRSVHRVSPVGRTSRPRMVALYSYDQRPNMVFTQESQDRYRYPDSRPFLGALTPAGADGFTLRESPAN